MICDLHLIRECVLLLLRVVQVGVWGERVGGKADALRNFIDNFYVEFQLPGCSTLMPRADGFSGTLDSLGFSAFVTLTCIF